MYSTTWMEAVGAVRWLAWPIATVLSEKIVVRTELPEEAIQMSAYRMATNSGVVLEVIGTKLTIGPL